MYAFAFRCLKSFVSGFFLVRKANRNDVYTQSGPIDCLE